MTMQAMVEYLESKGFDVDKKYDPKIGGYQFSIIKGNCKTTATFTYPVNVPVQEKNRRQEEFLDGLLKAWYTTFGEPISYEIQFNPKAIAASICYPASLDTQFAAYAAHDVENTKELWTRMNPFIANRYGIKNVIFYGIKNVIFNDPATIVFWTDGTKTVVKAENEPFDPEKGLAMAISKKALGNKGNYYNAFTKWLPKED